MTRTPNFLRWPTSRSKEWLDQFLAHAKDDENVLAVVAIGSGVRPNVKSNDLDLLVVTAGRSVRANAPIEVDLRYVEAEGIDRRLEEGYDLLGWAATFGIPLIEKNRFWHRFVDRHRGK